MLSDRAYQKLRKDWNAWYRFRLTLDVGICHQCFAAVPLEDSNLRAHSEYHRLKDSNWAETSTPGVIWNELSE